MHDGFLCTRKTYHLRYKLPYDMFFEVKFSQMWFHKWKFYCQSLLLLTICEIVQFLKISPSKNLRYDHNIVLHLK